MNPDAAEIDYRVLNYNVSVRIVHTARAIQTQHIKHEIHADGNDSAKEMNRMCLAAGEGHSARRPPSEMEKWPGWHAQASSHI